jgi:hypothetical protein
MGGGGVKLAFIQPDKTPRYLLEGLATETKVAADIGAVLAEAKAYAKGETSFTANGWQKLPSGLIIQWGQGTTHTEAKTQKTFLFPVAFPHNALNVTGNTLASNLNIVAIGKYDTSHGYVFSNVGHTTGIGFYWIAIGY